MATTKDKMKRLFGAMTGAAGGISEKYDEPGFNYKAILFRPYQSPLSFFHRTATIATAPIVFTGLSACFLLKAGLELANSLLNLLSLHPEQAKEHFSNSVGFIRGMFDALFYAATSPLINTADLIGGGIASLKQGKAGEETAGRPQDQSFSSTTSTTSTASTASTI